MARKANGEGTITKRKDGKYMGRVTVGRNINGKLVRKTVYGDTKQETFKKMTKIQSEYFSGVFNEPSKMSLSNWLNTWLKTYKTIKLRSQTISLYKTLIRTMINPRMGEMKLKHIKPMHIQELFNEFSNEGYSTSTLIKIKNILNPAFKMAVINKMINENPFQGIQISENAPKEVRAFSRTEQAVFEELSKESAFYEAFIVALDTGCRCGELLSLTWDDIDLDNASIYVNKTLIHEEDEETGKLSINVQDKTKTLSSTRPIPLTQRSLSLIKALRKKRLEDGFNDNNIVFCSKVGTYIYPRNFRRSLNVICQKANIPKCGIHVLRHSYATRLLEEGVSPKVAALLLGHKKIEQLLNTYAHVFPENKKEAVKVLDTIKLI